jgi:hypothetical protein
MMMMMMLDARKTHGNSSIQVTFLLCRHFLPNNIHLFPHTDLQPHCARSTYIYLPRLFGHLIELLSSTTPPFLILLHSSF